MEADGPAAELLPEPPTVEKALKGGRARAARLASSDRLIRVARDDEEAVVFGIGPGSRSTTTARSSTRRRRGSRSTWSRVCSRLDTADPRRLRCSLRARFEALHDTPHPRRRAPHHQPGRWRASAPSLCGSPAGSDWVPAPHAKTVAQAPDRYREHRQLAVLPAARPRQRVDLRARAPIKRRGRPIERATQSVSSSDQDDAEHQGLPPATR